MAKSYKLPSKILVTEKLIKYEVLNWLSRNVGRIKFNEDNRQPLFQGEGWNFTFEQRARSLFTARYIPTINFDDSVPDDIILYFLLRFGDSSE